MRVSKLLSDRKGNVAVMSAMLLPVLVGVSGLASDTMQWVLVRRALQRQADSAALAGAFAVSQGGNVSSAVTSDITRNSNFTLAGSPTIENAPTVGAYAGNNRAVRVVLRSDARLPFSGLFMGRSVQIRAEAVAAALAVGEFCALALEPTSAVGISMGGNTTVDLNCGMHTNSSASVAVTGGGSSWIRSSPVSAVGGVVGGANFQPPTVLQPYAAAVPDPYAGLPTPAIPNSPNNGDVRSNQTRNLTPGTYRGMDIQGTANLAPGTYFVDGSNSNGRGNGGLSIGAQARVNGTGVTFVLTTSTTSDLSTVASMNVNGGATMNITAPTSGTYAGILIYQDRRAPDAQTIKINGNASSVMRGAIYAANQQVEFTGTSGMNTQCLQLVARRLVFNGNSTVSNNCPANTGSSSFKGTLVRLVS